MQAQIMRKLFLGFIHIHILHQAKQEAFYGSWMIEALKSHGYEMSAGTLYPILHTLEKNGVLHMEKRNIEGRMRKYYSITVLGEEILEEAKQKAAILFEKIQ